MGSRKTAQHHTLKPGKQRTANKYSAVSSVEGILFNLADAREVASALERHGQPDLDHAQRKVKRDHALAESEDEIGRAHV